ncbi:hypothetical protein ACI2VH_02560 [Ralstonia nicotianae]
MDAAFAEHFAGIGKTLDEYAVAILDCLLKRGEFSELQDVIGVKTLCTCM